MRQTMRNIVKRSIIRDGSFMGISKISKMKLAMQYTDRRAMVSALCAECGTGGK
jgi:hypothetical protein